MPSLNCVHVIFVAQLLMLGVVFAQSEGEGENYNPIIITSPLNCYIENSSWIFGVEFSPNGVRVASGSDDGFVRVWDTQTNVPIWQLQLHQQRVNAIAYSPSGQHIATSSLDGTAGIWNAETGENYRVLSGHSDSVLDVNYSQDGTLLVTSSRDNTAKVWDVLTGALLYTLVGHGNNVTCADISPSNDFVVTGSSDKTLKIWNLSNPTIPVTLSGHTDIINELSISPDGQWVISTSNDHTARVWSMVDGTTLTTYGEHTGIVTDVSIFSNGFYVLTGSRDNTAHLWDPMTGNTTAVMIGSMANIGAVSIENTCGLALTGNRLGDVCLWDLSSIEALNCSNEGEEDVCAPIPWSDSDADCSPDYLELAVGTNPDISSDKPNSNLIYGILASEGIDLYSLHGYFFTANQGSGADLDADGLADRIQLKMLSTVLQNCHFNPHGLRCLGGNVSTSVHEAVEEAFRHNLSTLQCEPEFESLSNYQFVLSGLLLISGDMQTFWKNQLGLVGVYSTYAICQKSDSEPFTAAGSMSGDDTSNLQRIESGIQNGTELDNLLVEIEVFNTFHSIDTDYTHTVGLTELLRLIQLFNFESFHCNDSSEDGFSMGSGDINCIPHSSDFIPRNWKISLTELLRSIQIFNVGSYSYCPMNTSTYDGFCTES